MGTSTLQMTIAYLSIVYLLFCYSEWYKKWDKIAAEDLWNKQYLAV